MDDLATRIAELDALLPLTEPNVDVFLEKVASITATGDRRAVAPILLRLDEHCSLGGVVASVHRLLEDVSSRDYVEELLAVLPAFQAKSPFLAEDAIRKLLWSDRDRALLAAAARGMPAENAVTLRRLLERANSPSLAPAVEEVRRALDEGV